MPRTRAISLLEGLGQNAELSEIYGVVIESIKKETLSQYLKSQNYTGNPAAGSVEFRRFVNSRSQPYGTARAAGRGDAVQAPPITVNLSEHEEIVEEVSQFDLDTFGVGSIMVRRAADHIDTMASVLDIAFFDAADQAANAVVPQARLNRPWVPGISFPATLFQILQDACSQCNVTLGTLEFDNDDYVVGQKPEGDDITNHHIVAWIAQLAGSNAWIDPLGRLQLSWYGDNQSGDLEIGPRGRFEYELAEKDIEITGIVYRTGEIDYLVGTEDYTLIIEDNPLLQEGYESVLATLYSKIEGFRYRPYSFSILGYPHLWPGDVITTLIDADGNELTSIITNHTYVLNGNSQIEARGETETVRGYATGAPFTAAQKRVLQSVAKVEVERQTSGLEQSLLDFNQLISNALGYYETYHTLPSGAKIRYVHDQPTLEDSMKIHKYSAEGYGWTNQGWQGGSPVWHGGIDAAGNIIAQTLSVIGVKAEWLDVDDLSAITGNFTTLQAGDAQAYLDLRAINKSPQMSMFAYLPNLATWDILQSSYVAPIMFMLEEDWRGEADPVSSFTAPARVDLHANKLHFSYKTKPLSGGWNPVTSQWIDGMELGFYPNRTSPVQLDCYGHDMEIDAPKVGITGDLLIRGDMDIYSWITHLSAASSIDYVWVDGSGEAYKFSNGLMFCVHVKKFTLPTANQTITESWTFPTPFVDAPPVIIHSLGIQSSSQNARISSNSERFPSMTQCQIYISIGSPSTGTAVHQLFLLAIGRWK